MIYFWFTAISGVSEIQNAKISGNRKLVRSTLCLRSFRKYRSTSAPRKKTPLICKQDTTVPRAVICPLPEIPSKTEVLTASPQIKIFRLKLCKNNCCYWQSPDNQAFRRRTPQIQTGSEVLRSQPLHSRKKSAPASYLPLMHFRGYGFSMPLC